MLVEFLHLYVATPAPMISTVQFQIPNINVSESDGSVIVNLIRAGNNSDNITVCIAVTMVVEPAMARRMYKLCIACTYVSVQCLYIYAYVCTPSFAFEQRRSIHGF